jgi:hypothetical protein
MELYHFTDEQWNNLKAILTDNKDGFTDDQWKITATATSSHIALTSLLFWKKINN